MVDLSKFPLSLHRRAGDLLFMSGQLGFGEGRELVGDDIESQTQQALENINSILKAHNLTPDNIVKMTCWITDKSDFPAFNKTYAAFFESGVFPTRATVVSGLLAEGAKVELEAVAHFD